MILLILWCKTLCALPENFVYLHDIDPSIIEEMRYSTSNNFVGRAIDGYYSNKCILTWQTAKKLSEIQKLLLQREKSIKVYDCYRPERAVMDFIIWSRKVNDQKMKKQYYPRINKKDIFLLEYVAQKSGHSRGSTVDLTIVNLSLKKIKHNHVGLICASLISNNEINMGSSYDCLDEISHFDSEEVDQVAYQNRLWLRRVMIRHGFVPYDKEWWHFTLKNEPYPNDYFNFTIS